MIKKMKKNEDFQKIYRNEQKCYGHYCLIFFQKETNNKYGFVASKKIGNAVCRNRIKRLFREFVKNHQNHLPKNYSFIFVAKKTVGENLKGIKYSLIEKDLLNILSKNSKKWENTV